MSTSEAAETAHLLSKLLEVTSQEQKQLTMLLSQHGTIIFWDRLETLGFSAELLEKLQALKGIIQAIEKGRNT